MKCKHCVEMSEKFDLIANQFIKHIDYGWTLEAQLALEKKKCKEIVDHYCHIQDETGWVCSMVTENKRLEEKVAILQGINKLMETHHDPKI